MSIQSIPIDTTNSNLCDRQPALDFATTAAHACARRLAFPSVRCATLALARFLAAGCIGLAVDIGVFEFTVDGIESAAIARSLSLAMATLVTWQINRHFTFKAATTCYTRQAVRYALTSVVSQGASYGLFLLMLSMASSVPDYFAILIGAVVGAALNFVGQSIFGFRDRADYSPLR